LRCFIWNLLSI